MGLLSRLHAVAEAPWRKRLNRAPSPMLARLVPWLTVMLGSLLTGWIAIADSAVIPPVGLLLLIGWRQLHPGVLPVWAGLPLGLFDDLLSGQPPGSAMLLWSLVMLVLEIIEAQWPWRNFAIEWVVAATLITGCVFAGAALATGIEASWLNVVALHAALSALAYPMAGRIVAFFDRMRLAPIRAI